MEGEDGEEDLREGGGGEKRDGGKEMEGKRRRWKEGDKRLNRRVEFEIYRE